MKSSNKGFVTTNFIFGALLFGYILKPVSMRIAQFFTKIDQRQLLFPGRVL
jgi:hypothetical protein